MDNEYLFFRLNSIEIDELFEEKLKNFNIEVFKPTLFNLRKHHSSIAIYLFWYFFTYGRYKIIYLLEDDKIIHYSHVLPKFFKFPFLNKNDLEIGPSWTAELHRGKGIFPTIIYYIVSRFQKKDRDFYIFAHAKNSVSLKAIKKIAFREYAIGYKTDIFGIYKFRKTKS